jgi:hypothetical protein
MRRRHLSVILREPQATEKSLKAGCPAMLSMTKGQMECRVGSAHQFLCIATLFFEYQKESIFVVILSRRRWRRISSFLTL